jgi:hypothetical protein
MLIQKTVNTRDIISENSQTKETTDQKIVKQDEQQSIKQQQKRKQVENSQTRSTVDQKIARHER